MIECSMVGEYILTCDVCDREAEEIFDSFYEAVDYKTDHGWKSRKDEHNNWVDVCPECATKPRRGRDFYARK